MVFKLPNPPSPQAAVHELADFAEILSWQNGSVSVREIVAYLGRVDDNNRNIGCQDDDDENAEVMDEVMNEIERRSFACVSGYPFVLEFEGTVLKCPSATPEDVKSIVYLYLLLSTRLNMKSNRKHAGVDGAALLEDLSGHVLQAYLGANGSKSYVFGTSSAGTFKDKVNKLCKELCEGVSFRSLDPAPVHANDDKLDTVAWIPFADRLPGQLIVFCQCKTGTNWRNLTSQLQPEAFIKKWMREPYVVNPLRAFCISEAPDRSRWKGDGTAAGIVLDRCRIVSCCNGIPQETSNRIRSWTLAAKNTINISSA